MAKRILATILFAATTAANAEFSYTMLANHAIKSHGILAAPRLAASSYASAAAHLEACKRMCDAVDGCAAFVVDDKGICKAKSVAQGYGKAGKTVYVKGEEIVEALKGESLDECVSRMMAEDGLLSYYDELAATDRTLEAEIRRLEGRRLRGSRRLKTCGTSQTSLDFWSRPLGLCDKFGLFDENQPGSKVTATVDVAQFDLVNLPRGPLWKLAVVSSETKWLNQLGVRHVMSDVRTKIASILTAGEKKQCGNGPCRSFKTGHELDALISCPGTTVADVNRSVEEHRAEQQSKSKCVEGMIPPPGVICP